MNISHPSGWVLIDVSPEYAGFIMAQYDKAMQLMNTHCDIQNVNDAKPEDFGAGDDGNELGSR